MCQLLWSLSSCASGACSDVQTSLKASGKCQMFRTGQSSRLQGRRSLKHAHLQDGLVLLQILENIDVLLGVWGLDLGSELAVSRKAVESVSKHHNSPFHQLISKLWFALQTNLKIDWCAIRLFSAVCKKQPISCRDLLWNWKEMQQMFGPSLSLLAFCEWLGWHDCIFPLKHFAISAKSCVFPPTTYYRGVF